MTIQFYPDELDYVNAKLHPLGGTNENSFMWFFLNACLHADTDNYELIRALLMHFMMKYPAKEERLEMERRDRGA